MKLAINGSHKNDASFGLFDVGQRFLWNDERSNQIGVDHWHEVFQTVVFNFTNLSNVSDIVDEDVQSW